MPALPAFHSATELAAFLRDQRNDLENPAIRLAPPIADVIEALAAMPGCLLARMSGSGATCFGLFDNANAAAVAAGRLGNAQPGWWVVAGPVQK